MKVGYWKPLYLLYTGWGNILTTMQFSYSGQMYRESLSFQWWRVSMFSFTEVSTPSYGLATLNHQLRWMSVPAVLKTSKWVLSAFSFASSSPQGDSAADKDLNLTYPSLFIVRYILFIFRTGSLAHFIWKSIYLSFMVYNLIEADTVHFPSQLWWWGSPAFPITSHLCDDGQQVLLRKQGS